MTKYNMASFILEDSNQGYRNMQTRSKEEILADMLEAAMSPTKKTALMFKANLNHAQLKMYLTILETNDLIRTREGSWNATEKGREFLNSYSMLMKLIETEESGIPFITRPKKSH